jgi:ATP/maltotriose-dependent transcriptional regulator MalT
LAQALAHLSGHQMVAGLFADGIANGRRAHALAERFGLESVAIYAMEVVGTCLGCSGEPAEGIALQREALDRAKRAQLPHEIALTCANLSSVLVGTCEPAAALPVLADGIAVAEEHELRYRRNCMLLARAEVYVLLGRWDDAVADAAAVLGQPDLADTNRCFALLHTGHVRALRGDPGALDALEESLVLAQATDEAQLIFPVRIALAEMAWVRGDLTTAAAQVGAAITLADRLDPYSRRELLLWARRTGAAWTPVGPLAEPAELVQAGDARGVAAFWDDRGCPYPAADALGDSDALDDLRHAFERLTALGARPRAQQVARRLRDLGAREVPRGPRASTRSNAAGLTAREVEVAALLVDGLTNADIAERLVLSPKTVDHHVSAVLAKLAVPNRRQVAGAASALGIELKDGVASTPT